MNFDRLACYYRPMERVLAGSKLQRCRTAFLRHLAPPRRALVLGEGTGEFLVELVRTHPQVTATCLDSSQRMLTLVQARLSEAGCDPSRHEFRHQDILAWSPIAGQYDLIVTHFFLDCFREQQLGKIADKLGVAATPSAVWLLADFRLPPSGWRRWRAGLVLRSMYWFFRWTTALDADHLTPPDRHLADQHFALQQRRISEWGLLHTDLWARRLSARPS